MLYIGRSSFGLSALRVGHKFEGKEERTLSGSTFMLHAGKCLFPVWKVAVIAECSKVSGYYIFVSTVMH